ncbi:hypothetical protein BJX63DRAFT_434583 [Aspergillus granulosus]|uniref:C2H2-type domain-containing protein n=1 Tax=Aspergillus granulosus TaxID=176169 RepID=A0ABR4H421_9EURO
MEYGSYGGESGGGGAPEWPGKDVYERKPGPELCNKKWPYLSKITKSDPKFKYAGSGKAEKSDGYNNYSLTTKNKIPEEHPQEGEHKNEKVNRYLPSCGIVITRRKPGSLSSSSQASVSQEDSAQSPASEVVTGQYNYSGTPHRGLSSSPDSGNYSDSDWLSISDSSDDYAQNLDLASLPVFADVVDRTFVCYSSWRQHGQQNDTIVNQSRTPKEKQGSSDQKQGSPRKRLQDDGSSNDGSSPRSISAKKQKSLGDEKKHLACPYWKKSPQQYRKCFRYELNRIQDVKQHIHRCHQPAYRCLRCGDTFPSEDERDLHARADPACEVRHILHDDLSQTQLKALTRRSNPKLTTEEQWYAIWDIVFPEVERPCSPYIDSALSEEFSSFKEFYFSRGPSILLEVLEKETTEPFRQENLQELPDAVFRAGLDRIMGKWLFTHAGHQEPSTGVADRSITPCSLPLLTMTQPAPVRHRNIVGNRATLETTEDSTLWPSSDVQDMHGSSGHLSWLDSIFDFDKNSYSLNP